MNYSTVRAILEMYTLYRDSTDKEGVERWMRVCQKDRKVILQAGIAIFEKVQLEKYTMWWFQGTKLKPKL